MSVCTSGNSRFLAVLGSDPVEGSPRDLSDDALMDEEQANLALLREFLRARDDLRGRVSCEQRLFTSRAVDRARGPTTTSSRSASFTRLRCPTAPALPAASKSRVCATSARTASTAATLRCSG